MSAEPRSHDPRLDEIVEGSPFPVLRVRADGLLDWANPAAAPILRAWGCGPEQPVPATWAARFALIGATGTPTDIDLSLGARHMVLTVCPSPRREHVVVYGHDASPAPQGTAEGAADAATSGDDDEGRLGSAILANMSHELRTPLNAIVGYAELLADELSDRGERDLLPDLEKITRSADALRRMITDLLEVAKIEAGRSPLQVERFEVADLVDDVALSLASEVEAAGNQLEVTVDVEPPDMVGDPQKVRRMLSILLGNANKFTSAGGIVLSGRRTGGHVVLEVSDTGIGMDSDQISRIFRPFQQGDRSARRRFGGTGLGLAIVRVLCEQLGGTIGVASEPGRGTTFTVRLPARPSRTP